MRSIGFIAIISLILFSSCTIEKRLYTRGYHIERVKFNSIRSVEERKNGIAIQPINPLTKESKIEPNNITIHPFYTNNNNPKTILSPKDTIDEIIPFKKTYIPAIVSFGSSAIGSALGIIWFFNNIEVIISLAITFLIVGLILGIATRKIILHSEGKLGGIGFSQLAILLGILGVGFFFGFFSYYFFT